MILITNRRIHEKKSGFDMFGDVPSDAGPHELRLVEISKKRGGREVRLLDDALPKQDVVKLKRQFSLDLDDSKPQYASLDVACRTIARLRKQKKHLVFFVHGYNNDVADVVRRADGLSESFGVEVVAFSWPANGGGARGVADYKSDKRDARASVGALDRALEKIHQYLTLTTSARRRQLLDKASQKHPTNAELRDAEFARLVENDCPVTVNLLLHSMGNYLFKQLLKSSASAASLLTFDNVVLVAADTNNLDHRLWVDRIRVKNRVFVTINERDFALAASRAKSGQQQLARLGHSTRNLDSRFARYVDVTRARYVTRSHAYFEGNALRNEKVKKFFRNTLHGKNAERGLPYESSGNYFVIR